MTMPAENIVATVRARGGMLYLVDGERIAVTPRAVLDADLRAAIRATKAELVRVLRAERVSNGKLPVDSFDYFASPYADLFRDLTGDTGGAPGDLDAVMWAERNGWPDILGVLRAIDRRCEELAAADNEADFRSTVGELVSTFRAIRAAYAAATDMRTDP